MKAISHFEVNLEGCIYRVTIRLRTENPKSYTADWHCAKNGQRGQLGYDLPECHLVELDVEKEIRENHDGTRIIIHDGKEYQIRCAPFENGYKVAVFHNGQEIPDTAVHVRFDVAKDPAMYHGMTQLDLVKLVLEDEIKLGKIYV